MRQGQAEERARLLRRQAYLGDATVAAFIARENPAAIEAMRKRFDEAVDRGLWQPRRNSASLLLDETREEAA